MKEKAGVHDLMDDGICRYKLTMVGFGASILIGVLSYAIDLDPFDRLVDFFNTMEHYELDELFVAWVILMTFITLDLLIQQRNQKIENEKTKVYKAMISSTHHILNNFLNQMQIFKITAQNTPGFDQQILDFYDTIIDEATNQLEALSSLKEINEAAIRKSVAPKERNGSNG